MTQALVQRAELACQEKRCEEALALLERVAWQQPGNYNLYFTLGLCASGGCRKHALLSTEIATTYLREALRLLGVSAGTARAAILDALGNTMARTQGDGRVEALRAAIEYHEEAAGIYRAHENSGDWARVQFNLGNSLCDLAEAAGEDHWREAISHYEQALSVRELKKNPKRHAAVLENLGSAYRRVDARRAIRCFERALRLYESIASPAQNAAVENNLGNAYLSLPQTDRRRAIGNAERALHHYDRALRLQAQDPGGAAYAIAQQNRAEACARLTRMLPNASKPVRSHP